MFIDIITMDVKNKHKFKILQSFVLTNDIY